MLLGKAGSAWEKPGEHPDPAHALSSFAKSLLLLFLPQDAARCGWLCSKIKGGVKNQPQSKSPFPSPPPRQQFHTPPWVSPWAPTLSLCCSKCGIHGAVSGGKLISSGKEPSQQAEGCGLDGTSPKKWREDVFVGLLHRVQDTTASFFACDTNYGFSMGTFRDSS